MNRSTVSLVAAILTIATVPASAQWLNVRAKGVPRTKDGKPDLSAPAPRKPDGKPDLSGIWLGDEQQRKYIFNMAADLKSGEFPIQPWAAALTKERQTDAGQKDSPPAHCLPVSIPMLDTAWMAPLKIVQEPDRVVILYQALGLVRQIFLDGRILPKDPNPVWLGYSVGRWDRDQFVIDTTGFNGKIWLDVPGHPTTEALHLTERFRRRDFGHLDIQITIDDSKAYTKPWTVALAPLHLDPDNDLLETVCNENEKDLKHLPGK